MFRGSEITILIIITFVVKNIVIHSWDRETIQFVQTLSPRETGIVINKKATYNECNVHFILNKSLDVIVFFFT